MHHHALQGPSLVWDDLGGNHGGLRCGKGTTWEGGQRVPSIARWTGRIAPGTVPSIIERRPALFFLGQISPIFAPFFLVFSRFSPS